MPDEDLNDLFTVREKVLQRKQKLRSIQVFMPVLSGVLTAFGVGVGLWVGLRSWQMSPRQHIAWSVGLGLVAGFLDYLFMRWVGLKAVERHIPQERYK